MELTIDKETVEIIDRYMDSKKPTEIDLEEGEQILSVENVGA